MNNEERKKPGRPPDDPIEPGADGTENDDSPGDTPIPD